LAALFNKIFLFGYLIVFCISCNYNTEEITYAEHIAPIVNSHCIGCHQPNEGGPFNLISYNDLAKRSKMIAHVTKIKFMPPWLADPNYSQFANQNILSEEQIKLFQLWHKQGAKLGDTTKHKLKPIVLRKNNKNYLELDIEPVFIKGNHSDNFFYIKVPLEIPQDSFVRMVEFIPGKPKLVHHVNGHLILLPPDDTSNIFDTRRIVDIHSPDFEKQLKEMGLYNNPFEKRIHSAVNYLPGVRGVLYPQGIGGYPLSQKAYFVLKDIHYGPSDKDQIDSSKLRIYLGSKPPERPILETMLGTNGISKINPPLLVKAGKIQKFTTYAFIPEDISILTINPHMHLLGKSFKAFAVKPNGDTIPLVYIPKWDFRWQYYYTFKKMLKIPKGSTIFVEAIYDNTTQNPNNPYKPPRNIGERMLYGGSSMRTSDEMLQFIISYLPYKKGDENTSLQ
jgi:hypothetical protein